jgi:7,8-dihydroneopterin aldolase/epimerase/oxygenase
MSDSIKITGIKALGFHGVFPEERLAGQEFVVDAELNLDLAPAGDSDDLTKTIDYSKVAELIHHEIVGTPVNLIESLATRISKCILKEFKSVESVKVTVHKPSAPIGVNFGDVSVSIERHR